MKTENIIKGISSLLSAAFHQSILFSLFILSNITIFLISYWRKFNSSLTYEHGYFLSPINCWSMTLFSGIGGIFERKIGAHLTIASSSLIIALGSFWLSYSSNWYCDFGIMILYGFGFGISCMVATKNACLYFPNHQGIMTALSGAGGNMGQAWYNYIAMKIINPDNIEVNEGEYYSFEIAKRFRIYLFMHIGIVVVSTCLSLLLFRSYSNDFLENESFLNEDNINNEDKNNLIPFSENSEKKSTDNEGELVLITYNSYKKNIGKAWCSYRLWLLFCLFFCTTFSQNIITTTFMTFGTIKHISPNLLNNSAVIMALLSCIVGPIWGTILDYSNFKFAISLMNIFGILFSAAFYFSIRIPIIFSILIVSTGCLSCGTYALMFPHILRVYTVRYSTEIYGTNMLSTGISNIWSTIYAFIITRIFSENINFAYLTIYLLGAGLNGIALIWGWFEDDEEFVYD